MNMQRLRALVRKEIIQIMRDRRFIALFIGIALVQMFVYSYAASRTVLHMPMAVADQSHDAKSREFVQALVNSQYFDEALDVQDENEVTQAIDAGQAKLGIVIPPDFATDIARGDANVLVLLDGSDSFAVRSGYSAVALVAQTYALQLTAQSVARGGGSAPTSISQAGVTLPIDASIQTLYNPDQNDRWFVLPGIIGMILQTLAVEQAAIFVVRERELGTIEAILATPARQLELVVSKIIPLTILSMIVLAVSLGLSVLWFGVPFQGSLFLYFWLAMLFIASCLGLGLFIATRANTQLEAESLALTFMMLGILLSGLFYPRTGMPIIPTIVGDLVPLTYFVRISRGIYTRGVGLEFIWSDALILVVYLLVVVGITARRFKMRLD